MSLISRFLHYNEMPSMEAAAKSKMLQFVCLAAITGVSALHVPFLEGQHNAQVPLDVDRGLRKPLIDSEALQDSIVAENLLVHAQGLYTAAKLAEGDYNHPTRVIGSLGEPVS